MRDLVENFGRKFQQSGLAPIVQGEEGGSWVNILDVRENGGLFADHVHPLNSSLVLDVKESFGQAVRMVFKVSFLPIKPHLPLLSQLHWQFP
jgi:hypothetical protein